MSRENGLYPPSAGRFRRRAMAASCLWLAVLAVGFPRAVHAYSTGAGGCPAGSAAVGGYHLESTVTSETGVTTSRIVRSGPLSEGEFVVTLGDAVLSPVNVSTTTANAVFRTNQEYEIAVFSNRYEYKGILIRLEYLGDRTITVGEALLPDVNTQIAVACFGSSNVIGITHLNNTFKTLHSGLVQVDQAGPVALDITVVGLNNATASLYGYDRFLVEFAQQVPAPTTVTTTKPSGAPSVAPIAVPTVPPTASPTSAAPSGTPTAAPVRQKNTTGLAHVAVQDEVVQSIALTLSVVKELSEPEVRAWERATMEWFQEFYNDTAIDRSNTRQRRNLQNIYNNYGVVLGSMETFINVTNVTYPPDNVFASSTTNATTPMNVTLTYDQRLSYQAVVNASYPGPMQYVTLPFRSRVGRRTYVEELRLNFYAFSQLSTESLAIPILQGPPVTTTPSNTESTTDSMSTEDDGLSVGAIVGMVLAVSGVVAVALYVGGHYYAAQQKKMARGSETMTRPVGHVEFDAETFSFAASYRRPRPGGENAPSKMAKNEYTIYAPAGRLGIVLDSGNSATDSKDGPVVCMIKEGSPLMDSMVEVGDHIVALDDIDVRNMLPVKVSKLMNKRSKHPIRKLTFIRSSGMCTVVQVAPQEGDATAAATNIPAR